MKYIYITLLFVLLTKAVDAQALSEIPKGHLIACGDDKVVIIDPKKGNDSTSIVWSWSVKEAKNQLPEQYQKLLMNFDECKPIDGNKKILLTSSGGATCILNVERREVEFYAHTPMAHSADVLPNGYVAVANSTHPKGNSLEIYHRSKPEVVLAKDTLYSGHGAVWHKDKERLFVLGFDDVRTYKLNTVNNSVELLLEKTDILPKTGGHDLIQIDNENFLVTAHKTVFVYNINSGAFSPFNKLEDVANVKSVNYFPERDYLVYTKAEESWWTFNIYSSNPDQTIHLPFIKLYKVRVVN